MARINYRKLYDLALEHGISKQKLLDQLEVVRVELVRETETDVFSDVVQDLHDLLMNTNTEPIVAEAIGEKQVTNIWHRQRTVAEGSEEFLKILDKVIDDLEDRPEWLKPKRQTRKTATRTKAKRKTTTRRKTTKKKTSVRPRRKQRVSQ